METEDVSLYDSGEWQVVEERGEVLPHVGVSVLSEAFIVESVDLGDLLALVVTSENGDSVWVSDLENDEESDCLNRVVASIDVISHEEVVRVWGLATNFKELLQVVELTVDVTANGHWCTHLRHVRLINQDFLSLLGKL